MRVGICLPSLPLPPIFQTPRWQAGAAEWALLGVVAEFAGACAGLPGVVVVNPQALATPPEGRHDVRADLAGDFPYRVEHVSAVAEALARAVSPPAPLKGIITDLDDTLWRGLVGEVGPEGVTWDLDHKSQGHALYQQMLASLADAGVLVAVASKNDAGVVDAALASPGLRIARDRMFPVEASWGLKSEAVARILAIWNIGADSVVFVDDSPLELAEVAQRFPDMRCTRFPTGDDAELLRLLGQMRDWFGKERVGDEDRLRLDSIRSGAALMAAAEGAGDEDAFLHGLGAKIAVDFRKTPPNPRAPELINKTNQFNLNGRRVDAADWKRLIDDPASFLAVVSYEDKFGPLGAIAVAAGTVAGDRLRMHHWVLSCRAFSRRIEHRTLAALFEKFPVEAIELDFVATARNGPFAAFLAAISVDPQSPAIGRQAFAAVAPAFPIEMVTHE
jgi:FkbH-like protein